MIELEAELFRVEGDGAAHVLHLIPDPPKIYETLQAASGRTSFMSLCRRFFLPLVHKNLPISKWISQNVSLHEAGPRSALSACRTRRGGGTRPPSHYALVARGRATGTCPKGGPVRAHTWNRCGRRRRPRPRTRSGPAYRASTSAHRFRTWPPTGRQAPGPVSRPSRGRRAGSCIR